MNRSQWIALAAAIVLTIGCFMPWAIISGQEITISGVDTSGTRFGKPAYLHFVLTSAILILTFIKRIWAKRINLLFTALNLAWAIKNFILFGRCEAGECPERQMGLYLVLAAAIALLVTGFFPNMKIPVSEEIEEKEKN